MQEEKKRRSERNAEAEQKKKCSMATPPPPPLEAGSGATTDDIDATMLVGTATFVAGGFFVCLIALVYVSVGKRGEEWSQWHRALIRSLGWMLLGVLPFAYLLWLSHFGNSGILSWSQSQRRDILFDVYLSIAGMPALLGFSLLLFLLLACCVCLLGWCGLIDESDGSVERAWWGGSDTKEDDEKKKGASASNGASAAPLLAMTMPGSLPRSPPKSP